jgi:hypothetical protein
VVVGKWIVRWNAIDGWSAERGFQWKKITGIQKRRGRRSASRSEIEFMKEKGKVEMLGRPWNPTSRQLGIWGNASA